MEPAEARAISEIAKNILSYILVQNENFILKNKTGHYTTNDIK